MQICFHGKYIIISIYNMSGRYKIKKFKSKRKDKRIKFGKLIPPLNFRMLIVAPSGGGKSLLTLNLLKNKKFPYAKHFDDIYVFSTTLDQHMEDYIDIPQIEPENLHDDIDEEALGEIFEKHKDGERRGLIYFDDILDRIKWNNGSMLNQCFYKSRHYNLSVICCVQKYCGGIPPILRMNCNCLIVFRICEKELNGIFEEHNNGLNKRDFFRIAYECWEEPYSFMTINYSNKYVPMERFIKRFEQIVRMKDINED